MLLSPTDLKQKNVQSEESKLLVSAAVVCVRYLLQAEVKRVSRH